MNSQAPITADKAEALFGNSNKQNALMLLGRGTSPLATASILGVSPSLISQFLEDDTFKSALADMLAERELAASIRDEAIDKLEDRAIEKVEAVLDYITKPMEAVALLKTINSLNRTGIKHGAVADQARDSIKIDLPKNIVKMKVAIEVDSNNQVIEVEGRGMQTMDHQTLMQELNSFKDTREVDKLLTAPNSNGNGLLEIGGNNDDTRSETTRTETAGRNKA